VQKRESTTPL